MAIDALGGVWLTNSWKDIPIQGGPAGDGLVVYIGLAAPVLTPSVGHCDSRSARFEHGRVVSHGVGRVR